MTKMIVALELEVKELAKNSLTTSTTAPKNKLAGLISSKLSKMLDENAVDISLQPLVNMVNKLYTDQTSNLETIKLNS